MTSPPDSLQPTNAGYRRQMREQGYADGCGNREKRWPSNPDYAAAWRRGQQARAKDAA